MRIVSYRGSNAPGGVSSALTQLYQRDTSIADWWSISERGLVQRKRGKLSLELSLDDRIKAGHYRFCNNFLWPILHDMPAFAHYSSADHIMYTEFTDAVAYYIDNYADDEMHWFINDYQFALLPNALDFGRSASLFWHIPWPVHVESSHVEALSGICRAMLRSTDIGFHTQEYVNNFESFVCAQLPDFEVDSSKHQVLPKSPFSRTAVCSLHAAPLGTEPRTWSNASTDRIPLDPAIPNSPFVLSVDRADYTKGVYERLCAIEVFFEKFPEYLENFSFVQICTRSREGLKEFDRYWQLCNDKVEEINRRFLTADWRPIVWRTNHHTESELTAIYARASIMLVSPIRDGLNLTAKEFVLSQIHGNGILALSRGAGVYTELGDYAVTVDPLNPTQMAEALAASLTMDDAERRYRLRRMREKLLSNSLIEWWRKLRHSSVVGAVNAAKMACG